MLIPLTKLIKDHSLNLTGVLHVGANLAQEAPMYKACGLGRMIFIEALPDIYDQMLQNIARYPGAEGRNACVSDKSLEKVTFNVANNEGQSSSLLSFGTHSQHHPTVKFVDSIEMYTQRLDEMDLDLTGINFLCLDIQGVELRAMKGLGKLIEQFDFIYSEVNDAEVYVGCDKIWEIDEYLTPFGFERVETKMTSANWGDAAWKKK